MIDLGLTGKRAIVVGAGFRPERAGHGRGIALRLAEAGAKVACIDCDRGRGDAIVDEITANGGEAFAVLADVTDPVAARRGIDDAIAGLGGADICVDVIGDAKWATAVEMTDEDWSWTFTQCLTQVVTVFRAVARYMIDQGTGGCLASVASADGLGSSAFHISYGAAKAAQISMTKTLAEELGPSGIRVNAVAPANVGGGVWDAPDVPWGSNPINPLHPPRPQDVANGLLFLCSNLAARITGQTLVIDGGASVRSPWGFTPDDIDQFNSRLPGSPAPA